jgi:tight adherence protein B
MGALVGLCLGLGLFLVWRGLTVPPRPRRTSHTGRDRLADLLTEAGIDAVTPGGLVVSSASVGVVVLVLMMLLSESLPIAVAFGVIAAGGPVSLVRYRARQRRSELRELWPEVVDNLASGVRAGLSLPEALSQLGERGPEELRRPFQRFGEDYRATGRFFDCLDRLKLALSDRWAIASWSRCGWHDRWAAAISAACCGRCPPSCARMRGPGPSSRPGRAGR